MPPLPGRLYSEVRALAMKGVSPPASPMAYDTATSVGSPTYDRDAIAKAMTRAEEDSELGTESDIQVPSTVAWPSAKKTATSPEG